MTSDDKRTRAETRVFMAVFPHTTNHYDTLFGGTTLKVMDEVAFICATRFSRKKMVTVASDRVDFNHPIPSGTLVEFIAHIAHVGRTSLKIQVDVFVEEMYAEHRERAVSGTFTLVAIDDDRQPIPVLDTPDRSL
ncbi:Acyl-CoA hydrolase [Catalinimonas alkaloidigena]|uniref:Acyl-CoA hydrolase n=1 Tax=Catalinimonas alkaloidigena TaxID=1075417 RepID=A0A1G9TQ85_9BACT|nr:acyl-CoA thioesterase [Catalinimonas alkaloidigena]SDM49936.1 Acyl-CoA hydrolase [Catalinimonas alkaloidigena]